MNEVTKKTLEDNSFKFLTADLVDTTKFDEELVVPNELNREVWDKQMLEFQDDPIFKFLPFPRWFRQKHKALLRISDDEKEKLKELKQKWLLKMAWAKTEENIEKLQSEYHKAQKTFLKKCQQNYKRNKGKILSKNKC